MSFEQEVICRSICDSCGKVHEQKNAGRPKFWSELILKRDAYDYQGCAVADGSVYRLLCDECTTKVSAAINSIQHVESET